MLVLTTYIAGSVNSKNIFDNLALSAPALSELRDELDKYLSADPESIGTKDVYIWWYERRARLHRMALDYLTIPGAYFFVGCAFYSPISNN